MPSFRSARPRVAALAAALALGLGLLAAPAMTAAAEEDPQTSIAGTRHTGDPGQRSAAPESPPQIEATVAPPANDDRADATLVPSLPFSVSGRQWKGSTLEAGEEAECRTTDPDVTEYPATGYGTTWYAYRSTQRQTLTFSGGVSGLTSFVSAFVDGPITNGTRLSCADAEYRPENHLQAEAGRTYYFQVGADPAYVDSEPAMLASFSLTSSAPVPNTTYSSATVIPTLPATVQGSNAKVDFNWYAPYSGCDFNAFMGSLWYEYTPSTTVSVRADVGASTIRANVGVYSSDGTTPGQLVECPEQSWENGVEDFSAARANTSWTAQAGTTYFIQVSSFGFTDGPFTLELSKVGTLTGATPTITGSGAVGSTLTAVPGAWSPRPVTLGYQWLRGGYPLPDATGPQYVVRPSDLGTGDISVRVTGTRPGYAKAVRTSAAIAVTPGTLTSAVPTITGSAVVGSTLTANPGTWNPPGIDLTYQWKRDGAAVPGATAATYLLRSADLGRSVTVSVTGEKNGYTTATRTSSPVRVGLAALTLTPVPTISGSTTVGSTLTATPGTWDSGVTLRYQWARSGTVIPGATSRTYVLTPSDVGARLTVSVAGLKPGFLPAVRTSAATATVAKGTLTGTVPTVSGTAKVGATLTATAGSWGPSPVTLRYQWKRAGTPITGATAATYKPVAADVGKTVTVTVTGSKPGYTDLARTSAGRTVTR